MSGPLDDLDFSINAHVRDAMEDIRDLSRQLDGILNHVDRLDAAFRAMGNAIGIPTAQVDLLLLRMQPMMNTLDKAKKQASGLEESFTRKLMAKALEEHQRKIVRLADGTERAKYQMIALADASRQIRTPDAGRVSSGQNSGVNFVRVTAAAGQLALLGRISGTLRNVRTGIGEVGTQTRISAGYMTRFRMGMNSIPVNPALNVVKNSFTSLGDAASKGLDVLRGMADAFLSDIPGSIAAAVGAAGQMGQSFDAVSNTVSKHVHKLHETQSALSLLATVFPFAKSQIEAFRGPLNAVTSYADAAAEKIDEMNAKFGTAAAEARGKAWVMTGVWKELGGTADTFARSQYYALLPQRMMMRELEGARRIIRAATYAWSFLTHPIHSVSLALAQSRAEWKDLRSRLPPLTGGLQLGTRAFRAFAQTAFIVGTTTRTVVTALTPLAKLTVLVARGTWSMVGTIRSATMGLIRMTGVQNTVIGRMLGMKKSTDEASAAMARLDRGNSLLSRGFGAVSSRAGLAKTAAAGLIATLVAVGTSTAIATEKNNAVFGTMLGDMQQGSAVVKSLQNTEAGKLFDNQELLDSGRLLFKAGISAQDLAGKTNQLATVAAATSTDLNDLARIYQQGASTGSFGQDKINQFAERGIDIYHALEAATGRSGAELKGMISDGKIGIAEMDSALAHMTEGHGIYAGSLAAMANTTGGKLAQMKNNISQALGDVMGIALEILHPFGTAMVSFTQSLRDGFAAFRGPIIYASTAVAWFFGNLVTIGKFAWATAQLGAITFFNDIVYFFGTTIPAYLTWFGENWSQVFMDAGNVVMTVFKNMAINIGSAMAAIWDYISSGGTTELQFAFVPLLDGFKATVAELPNIPDRAMTDLERQLTAQTEELGGQLANNFDAMLADASAKVGEADTQIKDTVGRVQQDGADTAIAAANKAAENKAVGVRTAEGQTLAAQIQRGLMSKEDRALKGQEEANGHLEQIERHLRGGNRNNAQGKRF